MIRGGVDSNADLQTTELTLPHPCQQSAAELTA